MRDLMYITGALVMLFVLAILAGGVVVTVNEVAYTVTFKLR